MNISKNELRSLLDDLQDDFFTYQSTKNNVNAMRENNADFDFDFFDRFVKAKHAHYLESRNAILNLIKEGA